MCRPPCCARLRRSRTKTERLSMKPCSRTTGVWPRWAAGWHRGEGHRGRAALGGDAGRIEEEVPGEDRDLQGRGLQQGHREPCQPAGQQALTEKEKGQLRPGDLHGRPPVGTRRDRSVPRVPSWKAAVVVTDGDGAGGRRRCVAGARCADDARGIPTVVLPPVRRTAAAAPCRDDGAATRWRLSLRRLRPWPARRRSLRRVCRRNAERCAANVSHRVISPSVFSGKLHFARI